MREEQIRLLVFSDDWGRHPSSCQHLVRELLPRFEVCWVDTIGTRRPRIDLLTFRRGAEKITGWLTRRSHHPCTADNPRVVDPIMWPSFRSRFGRWANNRLLGRTVRKLTAGPERWLAVTTIPLLADLVGKVPVERWVYYCVDDLGAWPGLDRRSLETMERELVDKVDAIIVVSEALRDRISSFGRSAELLTHGVDLEFWRQPKPVDPPAIEGLERPLIVFWGVVDRRLDSSWLRCLSRRLQLGTILLVGPANNPDPLLDELPNLSRIGPLPFATMPWLGHAASCLIMPYADLPVTRALQPLKLKEYLATGRPVVVSRLPATRDWHDACDLADSAESFADLVLSRLQTGVPDAQRTARGRLDSEDWSAKAATLERIVRNSAT